MGLHRRGFWIPFVDALENFGDAEELYTWRALSGALFLEHLLFVSRVFAT